MKSKLKKSSDWWLLDYDELQVNELLGEGSSGLAFKVIRILNHLISQASWHDQDVCFKTLKNLNESQFSEFRREAALMVYVEWLYLTHFFFFQNIETTYYKGVLSFIVFSDKNVVKLYGVCLDHKKPMGLVTEYMSHVNIGSNHFFFDFFARAHSATC